MPDENPDVTGTDDETLFDAPTSDEPDEDTNNIVYHQQTVDPATGQATVVTHGPMPVEEWSAYEREHKL